MKKLLILLLALAGIFTIAPQAEAGSYGRSSRYYDDCEYRTSYRHSYRREYYPSRRHYYRRPVRVVRYYDSYRPYRVYRSAPRFSFHFGF